MGSNVYDKLSRCVETTDLKVSFTEGEKGGWSLGELLDGHEYLVIVPVATTEPMGIIDFTK